ncbi:GntR family transcriptional regulator [Xanthobacter sp. DSM 24535]|uniref:GntR family transcriptional regulator n=1 Tax=Roseixanthobacter psychrophilus TaxID=3119917 RepID=UPI003726CCDD
MSSTYQISKPIRLGSEVYDILLKKLMSLEIQPGERIGVDRLARELGVSQTPIREALSQLEVQGLVVKVHLSGYRAASQLTRKQFDNLCELRLLIEPPAAAKAAALMSAEELLGISALAARMREPTPEDPQSAYSAFAQEDARFHAAIAKASQNDLLHDIITQQRVHLHLFRLRFYARVTQDAIIEHARILEAFALRDAEAAAAAMRVHIENAHARFKNVFED